MKPEGGDVVEGLGEAEVGSNSDGELQEVDQENLKSEGERDQSSQEVDSNEMKVKEKIQEVTKLVKELLTVGGEKWWRVTQKDQRRTSICITSPEEEKDKAHISDTTLEIRDVFGESDDEEPADYDAAQTNVEDDTNVIGNVCGASINSK
nr:protein LEO1 homolog isoform X2 [Tanacetum cinerariifolium]